ncbi:MULTISPECIES: PrkA family serine protein kinase [Clostridium]|uniref:Serine protein kinase (PrkA protein), P-loop containing n=4 Tax=Clostridium neonatale TaxID=137838 RepID=A0AA86MTE4_9CLOT|nr:MULTISPECIES: PrkA family serine protein kinase [Clostridium]MBP8314638.1 PrkA family serine protein kinase [Clostridium neonatale]MDU4846392.1 PrkA family serine protein kinase [Clostridium sp.]CAG9710668.1 Serine protein kinase (prkA protein), P-loop containing [Clostridium neonatale]CAI3537213.1 serine protein kinase [Clostridium neonatale]CAI3550164.1 serine protein kinase [Clostridium neonatale]
MDFKEFIEIDREKRSTEKFEGNFLDYLQILKNNPDIPKLGHQRLYEMILSKGVEDLKPDENPRIRKIYGNQVIRKYGFFKNDFYGIDKVIMKIASYLKSAAMKGEEARQVLYLVGPVGAGKSSIVESLKKALEECEEIYALKGCPMHEEPLHLIPKHLRSKFEDMLGIKIEGDLCPVCKYKLLHELDGKYEDFPVERVGFSIRSRKGIGVVPPVDPNNQDTSILTGSIDISKMDLYSEDDPRIFSLNGAFNVGNRGLVEFIEVFKNDVEYLHTIITATQEKSVPSPGKGSMIYFDGVIVAHSNEAEWNKFKSDHTNEAILDRIVKVEVPYCLELDEEVKIYEKILKKSTFKAHIAPHTIEIAAMFAILSRLIPSSKVDTMTKLKIYNGEEIVEKGTTKKIDIGELREEAGQYEGMKGISTRFIIKAIDNALSESEYDCINPLSIMESMIKSVKEMDIGADDKKKYLAFIQDSIRKEYNKVLEKEITKAFIHSFREQAESLFNNYIDNAEAYVNKTKIKDDSTGEELNPDEDFMRSIEEQIGVYAASSKGFRSDVTSYMFYIVRNGGKLDYTSYEPLKEAIEKKLTASVKDLSRIITKSKVRDKEQAEKYDSMVEEMKRNGYCLHCCDVILKYAANNLWRD